MPPRKKVAEPAPMPAPEKIMHPYFDEVGRKIMFTLLGILVAYAIVYLGTLIRNNLQEYHTIGYSDTLERTITLEAQGTSTITPDIAETTMGMRAEGDTVESAQEANTEVMNALIEGLEALGVESKDIQTANYNIYPKYTYTDDGRDLDGYEVSQSVSVTIRNIDSANDVLALAGEVGANSVSGLRFSVDDPDVYKESARNDALMKIREKVATLSETLGIDIVGIVTYNEYENGGAYPVYARAESYGLGGADTVAPKIEPGTNEVNLNVSVTFEIR